MNDTLEEAVKKYALPFETDADLLPLLEAIGDAKIVLLGEASHGTSEFYTVQTELYDLSMKLYDPGKTVRPLQLTDQHSDRTVRPVTETIRPRENWATSTAN